MNLATHLFGTENLDYNQLLELIQELKKPGIKPPGGLIARDPVVIMKNNTGKYTETGKDRIYLSKGKIGIQFKDIYTSLDWGYRLLVKTGLPWERALYKFNTENMKLTYFSEIWSQGLNLSGLCGLKPSTMELDQQLVKYLTRKISHWRHMTTPYPDSTPIARAYYSLAKGDRLQAEDGSLWEVTESKPQLSGPPEITLKPVEEPNG